MAGKSKFDYEIENFTASFSKYRDKKIVLYGTGRMTATLLNGLNGFQIIGLCDRDNDLIGKTMYGIRVLGKDEVEQQADLVVINTSASYWGTIYQRIKGWDIPIYFLNGELAEEHPDESADDLYWDKSYAQLKELIEKYDIISFDIFDTLIMRKVMLPMDIFRLTEARLNRAKRKKTGFMAARKHASALLTEPALDEIYAKMSELTGKSQVELEEWKQAELDTEKRLLTEREEMAGLCRETMLKKDVYFISDMYYSSEMLQQILCEVCGISTCKEQIIVSCEWKKTKQEGSLWEYYKNNLVGERKALHIGDNEETDVKMAERNGITAYHIMNGYQMLQKSSVKTIMPYIESLYSSISMGLICARLFNSPFALNGTKGKIRFCDEREAGYVLLGSLMYSFMVWLADKAKEKRFRNLVFFAREGYLLIPIYNCLKELLGDSDLPDAVYLEISRRAVWNASISSEEDIYEIADFPYDGSWETFLKERFGISIEEKELPEICVNQIAGNTEMMKKLLHPYKEKILERSKVEKDAYQAYFDTLGLKEEYAVVDSQFYGSTQYYLGKVLNKKLTGYYLCACTEADNKYLDRNIMYGCFQGKEGKKAKDTNVHQQAQFLEAFFTSPKGMLEYIDPEGKKKYAEEQSNQKNFNVRLKMMEGIIEFIRQMFLLQQELNIEQRDDMWSDILFGYFKEGFLPSKEMKKSFYFDNSAVSKREMPIWE